MTSPSGKQEERTGNNRTRKNRAYDVVLFGATGFVGALAAEYLAAHAPETLRWAVSGRDLQMLRELRKRLALLNPACAELPLIHADASEPSSVRELAECTGVLATAAGPYLTLGQELVAACAEAGTDYLDITGEPEFVDLTYIRHDAIAQKTGARIVHAAGFDSIPHDLGVHFTVKQLPQGVPLRIDGFVQWDARISGGTLSSALNQFSRGRKMMAAQRERNKMQPPVPGRTVRSSPGTPRHAKEIGCWALPLPTIDPQIVLQSARSLEHYGPDFQYRCYMAVRTLPMAVGGVVGASAMLTAAQLPPARRWLLRRLKPGTGPSADRRAKSTFAVRFVGEGGGQRVFTEVSGGDPGHDETSKMLAESAMCLALDDLPQTSGQVTTAVAMGDTLLERLRAAGISFRVTTGHQLD
ncbi:saccharopine dehydrogenase family protein [Streptomyces sp. NPDC098781]|uniref:saccharopine dehydrogenase family protein n=1 Tax=Streptomyces sp. NPDC098781 TaxID=3366097 RepID=UPI00380943DF